MSQPVARSGSRVGLAVALGVAALTLLVANQAGARTLAEVRALGTISMCASPETLPYASNQPDTPGFQIELGRAIAEGLGLALTTEWIVPRRRAGIVNCDMQLDSIFDPGKAQGSVLLSRPYQKSGVVLGIARDAEPVRHFRELAKDQKIGVMSSSVARVVLGKSGANTSPYAFQDDMVQDLAQGKLYGAAVSAATLSYYIQQNPQSGLRLVHAFDGEPDLTWDVAVGLRKSDQALVDEVNKVLERLLADGSITRIYARYGVEHRLP
jgi:polar amino acid transport system substrate-binding protein